MSLCSVIQHDKTDRWIHGFVHRAPPNEFDPLLLPITLTLRSLAQLANSDDVVLLSTGIDDIPTPPNDYLSANEDQTRQAHAVHGFGDMTYSHTAAPDRYPPDFPGKVVMIRVQGEVSNEER